MKLPSLKYLGASASVSLKRFPLTLLYAFISVSLAIWLIEQNHDNRYHLTQINALLCSALGIVLSFAIYMYTEKEQCTPKWRMLLQFGGLLVLFGLFFTFPDEDTTHNYSMPYVRYGLYNVTVHLLVAVVPFLCGGQINGFWNYNKSLFLRFLGSALFSGVLYAGLALALGSLDFLFNVDLHDELFGELWVAIAGIFNTWFFLSGIPKDFDELEANHSYPKGLKIFAQYVMLSLLVLYIIILYAYAGKIVLSDSWPKGIVPYLVSSVSVLGILTCMLLYPYGQQEENKWIARFSRIYYFLLIPLVIMLFVALSKRLDDYGITISRYALFALGVWLTIVCIYFMIGNRNIKFVPASLALALILISFGPWGMYSWSERSQVNRLEKILTDAKILVNGKIQNEVQLPDSIKANGLLDNLDKLNDAKLNDSLLVEIYSIMDYLEDHHGYNSIQSWFKQDVKTIIEKYDAEFRADTGEYRRRFHDEQGAWQAAMGITERRWREEYEGIDADDYTFNSEVEPLKALSVSGYDFYDAFTIYCSENEVESNNYVYETEYSSEFGADTMVSPDILILAAKPRPPYEFKATFKNDTAVMMLKPLIDSLMAIYPKGEEGLLDSVPQQKMSFRIVGKKFDYDIQLDDLGLRSKKDTIFLNNVRGKALIRKK